MAETRLAPAALGGLQTDDLPRHGPGTSRSTLSVHHARSLAEMRAELPDWGALYIRSGNLNPFTNPLWLAAWAEHYAVDCELDILFVRGGGELLGVAPFYRPGHWALFGPRRWIMFGSDGRDNLTELVEPLVDHDRRRSVLRAIVAEMADKKTLDWLELALSADQGWLETQWWPMRGGHPSFIALHKATVASVIMELEVADRPILLKRNLRRGIRHRRNQLERRGAVITVDRLDTADQAGTGLEILTRLHTLRSAMTGVPRHPNVLRSERSRAFLNKVLRAMALHGNAAIFVLRINDVPAAAQLVLMGNGGYYLALSGIDPEWWDASPLTILTAAIVDDAATRKATRVNFSTGPNTAKLAWSETIECHQQFAIVRRSKLSSAKFSVYWQARAFERFWREYHHQRRTGG